MTYVRRQCHRNFIVVQYDVMADRRQTGIILDVELHARVLRLTATTTAASHSRIAENTTPDCRTHGNLCELHALNAGGDHVKSAEERRRHARQNYGHGQQPEFAVEADGTFHHNSPTSRSVTPADDADDATP